MNFGIRVPAETFGISLQVPGILVQWDFTDERSGAELLADFKTLIITDSVSENESRVTCIDSAVTVDVTTGSNDTFVFIIETSLPTFLLRIQQVQNNDTER